jgi:hypothetical protein
MRKWCIDSGKPQRRSTKSHSVKLTPRDGSAYCLNRKTPNSTKFDAASAMSWEVCLDGKMYGERGFESFDCLRPHMPDGGGVLRQGIKRLGRRWCPQKQMQNRERKVAGRTAWLIAWGDCGEMSHARVSAFCIEPSVSANGRESRDLPGLE